MPHLGRKTMRVPKEVRKWINSVNSFCKKHKVRAYFDNPEMEVKEARSKKNYIRSRFKLKEKDIDYDRYC